MVTPLPQTSFWDNAGNFLKSNSNMMLGLGAGLFSGDLRNAPLYAMQGAEADDAYATTRKQEAERQKALQDQQALRSKYSDFFRQQNEPELADLVASDQGPAPGDLYWKWREANGQGPDPSKTPGGRAALAGQYGLEGDALTRYVLTGDMPAASAAAAPAGYRLSADGQGLEAMPGGPADPSNPLNRQKTNPPPSATVMKEILEADEMRQAAEGSLAALDQALELNKSAWDGPFADAGSAAWALTGDEGAVSTQYLKNIVTAQALESLKATFGAAPTEGERKILLDVQGSVNQPKDVRDKIFQRARAAAERRLKFNEERAAGLRSGRYFDEGYGAGSQGAPAATSTGIQWSYEP